MISLTLLTIILIRIYYFKLSETVNLNNGSHEIFINIFGTSTIIRGLFHTKPSIWLRKNNVNVYLICNGTIGIDSIIVFNLYKSEYPVVVLL